MCMSLFTVNSRYTSWLSTGYFRFGKRNLSNIRNDSGSKNKVEDPGSGCIPQLSLFPIPIPIPYQSYFTGEEIV